MSFPSSPTNGQTTTVNGTNYVYNSANNAWKRTTTVLNYNNIVWNTANLAFGSANAAFNKANTAITTTGGSITGQLNVAYTPATTVNAAVQITAANTKGGFGYADVLQITNTSAGVTNANKFIRLTSGGDLQVVNSGYNTTLLSLTDTGNLNIAGTHTSSGYQVNGKQAVNGPAFAAYQSITQSIPTDVQTKIGFNVEDYDTNNCFSANTFIPNVEGYYQISAAVRFDNDIGTGERMLVLYKNGSEYYRAFNTKGTASVGTSWFQMNLSQLVYANGTTDSFDIYAQHGAGVNRTTTANRAFTNFAGVMVRGA